MSSDLTISVRGDRPRNEMPELVEVDAPLAHTEDVALWIGALHVYSTGIDFTVQAWSRADLSPGGVVLGSYVHPDTRPDLLLAVVYGDGRVATNMVDFRYPPTDRSAPCLASTSSQSGGRASVAHYFLSPLPPPGPMTVVLALPGHGIGETRIVLDGSAVRDAAARVVALWSNSSD